MTRQRAKLLFCFLVFAAINAQAAITVNPAVAGASNYSANSGAISFYYSNISATTNAGPPVTYVGAAGGACNKNLNPQCHAPGDLLTISASSSIALNLGVSKMYLVAGTSPIVGNALPTPVTSATFSSASVWFTATFANICNNYLTNGGSNVDANCNMLATIPPISPVTIPIFLVANIAGNGFYNSGDDLLPMALIVQSTIQVNDNQGTAGLYQFLSFPGDSKVHMKNTVGDATLPNENQGTGTTSVRFYYQPGPEPYKVSGFSGLDPSTNSALAHFDTSVNTNGSFTNYYFSPLTNDTRYYFRAAIVDGAGNIGYLTNSAEDSPSHSAKPGQVAGLLDSNGQCFIATAAFGSPIDKNVKTLRQFRDEILLKSPYGKRFVSWYYREGPKWADRIRGNESARTFVRGALYPVVGFSELALTYGAKNASMMVVILLLMPLLFLKSYQARGPR